MLGLVLFLLNQVYAQPNKIDLAPEHGTYHLEDRAAYEFFAVRANFPGAIQAREVKILITGVDTSTPTLIDTGQILALFQSVTLASTCGGNPFCSQDRDSLSEST